MKRLIPILLLAAACLTSCKTDIVYSEFRSIPTEQWSLDQVPQFDYTIADTTVNYRMLIYVRHTERYPYQNMWLFVNNGAQRDTIEFYLADDRGQWLGDKHHGFIEMPVLLEENYHFSDTGSVHVSIQHGMRDSLLRGVTDIGFEVRTNGEK
ncbi:MAG: gliding motility lipoprotein GldH [Paludibacteraceae bacterium]|nr:gliding motility lipoprotein GldH [Paludibacteraceae bacterium]MBQ3998604.1 gliding motility lipoprotein GldH [Paludibacteraceae bacterium]